MEWIKFGVQFRFNYNSDVSAMMAGEAVRKAGLSRYLNDKGYVEYLDEADRDENYLKACEIWVKISRVQDVIERSKTFEGQGLLKIGTLLRMQDGTGEYLYLVGGELSEDGIEEGEFTRLRGDHIVLEYKYLDLA